MDTKGIISWLRDKAARAGDLNWQRMMHKAADRPQEPPKQADNQRRNWENGFQRWSNESARQETNPLGVCGYANASYVSRVGISNNSASTTVNVDISGLSGEYYIAVCLYSFDTPSAYLIMESMKLS